MFKLKCHQNQFFSYMSLCPLLENKLEGGKKKGGREKERKPIPILRNIYFSKAIHILFMPRVKFIYNVYNTQDRFNFIHL